jgi:hypothetical protein
MATELDKIFSGNKPCHLWIKAQHFTDHFRRNDHSPDMEMVSETLGFYPQLTRLVAREDFVRISIDL